eukprot:3252516-Pleurochrysis_carterae.AAC.2
MLSCRCRHDASRGRSPQLTSLAKAQATNASCSNARVDAWARVRQRSACAKLDREARRLSARVCDRVFVGA